ncbi:amidohydrolase family protein [Paenibacillus oryzisoli]|uniref:amidohydrolase family protein n=1 Tax=Paenibacillus oryzisoli TaxID=1850517 RepID=UPI003D29B64C
MRRIDAHQHYWSIARGDYGWITPALPVLYRDFVPEHLAPHLAAHHLSGSIVVQAAPTLEETDYLLSLADEDDRILGVVGWLDLHDPEHLRHYERFQAHPKFVGFRMMIQEMADARTILEPRFVEALRGYASEDVPVDLLLRCDQLAPLVQLVEMVPGLRGVIDHIAKPRIADGQLEPWLSQMKQLAQHPGLHVKLSGMVTEADHRAWKVEDFTLYIQSVLELFGPQRVMFGSDWPVCLLAADYDQVVEVLLNAIPQQWGEAERALLFGGNAERFYKLSKGESL